MAARPTGTHLHEGDQVAEAMALDCRCAEQNCVLCGALSTKEVVFATTDAACYSYCRHGREHLHAHT